MSARGSGRLLPPERYYGLLRYVSAGDMKLTCMKDTIRSNASTADSKIVACLVILCYFSPPVPQQATKMEFKLVADTQHTQGQVRRGIAVYGSADIYDELAQNYDTETVLVRLGSPVNSGLLSA